jgi:hypothetical protein
MPIATSPHHLPFNTQEATIHNTYFTICETASPAVPIEALSKFKTIISLRYQTKKGASLQCKMNNKFLEQLFILCRLRENPPEISSL